MAEADVLNKLGGQLARIATALEVKPAAAFVVLVPPADTKFKPYAVAISRITEIDQNESGEWRVTVLDDFSNSGNETRVAVIANGEEVCAALGIDPARLMTSTPAVDLAVANE